MPDQHLCHLLHWFQLGLQCSGHPVVEKLFGEIRSSVIPEPLEVLAQQVTLYRCQIEFKQFTQPGRLLFGKVLRAFQKQPAAAFENILLLIGLELLDFAATDIIDCLVKLPHDVEAIKNIQRLWCLLGDDLEVRALTYRCKRIGALRNASCRIPERNAAEFLPGIQDRTTEAVLPRS